jgi:hypothetical protein
MSAFFTPSRRFPSVCACLILLLLSRVPAMVCPFELNRDESQMAAQAMRYEHDLTPWRSVEGETNGPLDSWLLLAAHDLGMPLGYRELHILGALCLASILLATYAAARSLVGETPALLGLAAGSWWLACAPVEDLTHYSSELVPGLLISLALAAIARARRAGSGRDWRWGFAAGALLGLAPWGKLQSGPVALVLGIWALADGLAGDAASRPFRRRYAAALIAGAILPGAFLLAWLAGAGALEEFWRVYIVGGIYHGRSRPWGAHWTNLKDLLFWRPDSPWIWDVALVCAGALWVRGWAGWQSAPRRILLLALLWFLAGVFVALRPITQWTHYAIFILSPGVFLAAISARVLLGSDPPAGGGEAGRPDPGRRRGWLVLTLGILPLPALNFAHYHYYRAARAMASSRTAFAGQIVLVQAVRHFVPQPRSLAVWGWKPSLYVDLGLPPATRNAVCAFLTDGNPNQEFLRAAFMGDLEKSRPELIVDVEDYVYRGRRQTAPETFPALADYLEQNYDLAGRSAVPRNLDYSLAIAIYIRRQN